MTKIRFLPQSIRINLLLIVLAGLLPMMGVILVSGLERRQDAIEQAEQTVLRLADYYAFTQENELARIRLVLQNLAQTPEVRALDPEACGRLFRTCLAANPNYVNFALIAPNGDALASALPFKKQNLAQRKEIREALLHGDFAVGEYSIGKVSKRQILPVALPVVMEDGRIIGLVIATLALQDYAKIFERAELPPGSFVGLADHNGVRLFYHPAKPTNPIGEKISPRSWEKLQYIRDKGLFSSTGSDGVERIFAVHRVASRKGQAPFLNIFLGIPKNLVIAKADAVTITYLYWLAISLVLSTALAWMVGKRGIFNRVNRLVAVAQRLGAGDLTARSGLDKAGGCLGQLATALDAMAEALERDIRTRIEMEQRLRQSREEAEAANKTKSEFLANMSHEIRTPLNGILSMLQLMQESARDPEMRNYVNAAINSSRRLTNLLSDILDLSRIEAGKLPIRSEPFDLAETVRQVGDLFTPTANQNGIELSWSLAEGLPRTVLGDAVRVQQVLNNLVGNALKFTHQGSVRIEVHPLPEIVPGRHNISFSVSDTGIGIPKELQDNIFNAFTQASQGFTRNYQGAGLGLAICRQLVELMDGDIGMESEPGQGTTVSCRMTFGATDAEAPEFDKADTARPYGGKPLRILLAEDDRVNQIAIQRLLEKRGMLVDVASDGEAALGILAHKTYDVVLMDIQMPVLNGADATRAIRDGKAGETNRDIPIIALTAYAMKEDREQALNAGMDDYISKPVEVDSLLETVEHVLERKTAS